MRHFHVVSRGNNHWKPFRDDYDFMHFEAQLGRFAHEHGILIRRYSLPSNHFHLLVSGPDAATIAMAFGYAKRRHTTWFKQRYPFDGHLWEKRIWVQQVDDYGAAVNYVENNPVKHGIVDDAVAYRFCSAPFYRLGIPNPIITPDAYVALQPRVRGLESLIARLQKQEMGRFDPPESLTRAETP